VTRKLDDVVSIAVAVAVTLIFGAQTMASWPSPLQELHKLPLERHHPIAEALHVPDHFAALH
jgi:hypothetical protein